MLDFTTPVRINLWAMRALPQTLPRKRTGGDGKRRMVTTMSTQRKLQTIGTTMKPDSNPYPRRHSVASYRTTEKTQQKRAPSCSFLVSLFHCHQLDSDDILFFLKNIQKLFHTNVHLLSIDGEIHACRIIDWNILVDGDDIRIELTEGLQNLG